jgi:hypothetical protein
MPSQVGFSLHKGVLSQLHCPSVPSPSSVGFFPASIKPTTLFFSSLYLGLLCSSVTICDLGKLPFFLRQTSQFLLRYSELVHELPHLLLHKHFSSIAQALFMFLSCQHHFFSCHFLSKTRTLCSYMHPRILLLPLQYFPFFCQKYSGQSEEMRWWYSVHPTLHTCIH